MVKRNVIFFSLFINISFISAVEAAQEIQLKTLQEMYSIGKKLEKGNEIIEMYADESLQRAFNRAYEAEDPCFGADIMWQSNDPPYQRKVTYTLLGNNKVRANLGAVPPYYKASWVTYSFSCKSGTCKLSDVLDSEGSLKKALNTCS